MSVGGLLLGLINIGIVVLFLLIIGLLVLGFCKWIGWSVLDDSRIAKFYVGIVALIALYMLVALLIGIPTWRIVRSDIPIGGWIPPPATIVIQEHRG